MSSSHAFHSASFLFHRGTGSNSLRFLGPFAKVVSISERPGSMLSLATFLVLFNYLGISHLALGAVPLITPHTDPKISVLTGSLIRLGRSA